MSLSTSLASAQQYLFQVGGPILLTMGTIGGMLNLMVFTKSSLRKSPCAICFVAGNIIDLIYLFISLIPTFLQSGYGINLGEENIAYCRSFYYIGLILSSLGPSYLILASIDRTLITSRNARIRKRSTLRLATICIISLALFWMIFHIHALIYMEILQYGVNYFVCSFPPGAYTAFITYYSLFIIGITPPLLMVIFGLWTLKNIRQVRHAIHPSSLSATGTTAVSRIYTPQPKDQQLIRILLMEIIVYIFARIPSTIFLIYQQITQYQTKSTEQTMIEQFIANITYFAGFIDSSISCYTNICVSKTFRLELKRIFLGSRLLRFCRPQ
jgi:hypothetical protein